MHAAAATDRLFMQQHAVAHVKGRAFKALDYLNTTTSDATKQWRHGSSAMENSAQRRRERAIGETV